MASVCYEFDTDVRKASQRAPLPACQRRSSDTDPFSAVEHVPRLAERDDLATSDSRRIVAALAYRYSAK